jgi:hypothetical protein
MRALMGFVVTLALVACSGGSGSSTSGGDTGGSSTGSDSTGSSGGSTGGDTSSGTGTGGIPVTGTPIGQICDQDHACHDAQDCVGMQGGATYCTIECGQSKLGAKAPPDGGPQLCAICPAISGTPACNTTIPNSDKKTETWLCGIQCGTAGGNDYGECPTGLTCISNNCQ